MQDAVQANEKPEKKEARAWVTVLIGVVVTLAIGLSLWVLFHVPGQKPLLFQVTVA